MMSSGSGKCCSTKGYLNAQVGLPTVELSEDKKWFNVTYAVNEGEPFTIAEVGFRGNTVFEEPELRDKMKIKPGRSSSGPKIRDEITPFDRSVRKQRICVCRRRAECESERRGAHGHHHSQHQGRRDDAHPADQHQRQREDDKTTSSAASCASMSRTSSIPPRSSGAFNA